jgi:hypothetical protein|tara:strand:- start:3530 stop:3754 length:225 start_codon:yes stop_codon:yes gene_type:complete
MLASKGGNIMTALKSFADRYVERFISRKFLAWLTATGLAVGGSLTSADWVAVTLAYIGSQALVDLAAQWKHGQK